MQIKKKKKNSDTLLGSSQTGQGTGLNYVKIIVNLPDRERHVDQLTIGVVRNLKNWICLEMVDTSKEKESVKEKVEK